MYIPKHFEKTDKKAIAEFITKNSFAIVTSIIDEKPWASHIPMEMEINSEGKWFLHGHLAKANPQANALQNGMEVLAIFTGPHAYISSGWYEKANVPTWNYLAVHVYGKVKINTNEELYRQLTSMVAHHEQNMDLPQQVEKMPVDMVNSHMKAIVGFTLEVTAIQGKWKLSQNRNDTDYKNVIAELEKLSEYDSKDIATEMKNHR